MININKHYKTLNIPVNSELSEAKKAYKKLALKYHPDRGGDPKKFQEIATAYEEIEKYKLTPKHNISSHINNSNLNEVFSNDINDFNFIFNNHFSNIRTQHNVNSQQHQNIRPSKTIRISTKVVNGKSETVIEETDTRSGTTTVRNY